MRPDITAAPALVPACTVQNDANVRNPDFLQRRLRKARIPLVTVDEGISGNRVLEGGAIPRFGPAAVDRIEADGTDIPGATNAIILEGINDLGVPPWPTAAQLETATPSQAVAHPNWDMGAKISVDSATMMNKGLEFIEAHHLFPVGLERIEIVVHPQSVILSLVEYRDGSTLAQLGPSDMRVPIASCLAWPQRMETPMAPLDLPKLGTLTFEAPDEARFPATRLAREAAQAGGAAPAVLNAANEASVAAFLAGKIGFTRIALTVERTLSRTLPPAPATLEDVLAVDREARMCADELLELA